MKRLLYAAAQATVGEFNFDTVFSGVGFNQLCIASGGVPRDFLYLFVQLSNKIASGSISSIGKIDVNDAAIANFRNKTSFMRTDSLEERNALEKYLEYIRNLIYREKRTNAFLIAKNEIENNLHERQAIRELLDLRLIHLVVDNISKAPSDGRRYEAYIVDVGMYDNSRPRSFTQIEPGQRDMRSRMDSLRASPVISIERMKRDLAIDESMLLLPSFPPSR